MSEAKTSADFSDLKDLDAATKAKFDALISAGVFDGVSDTSFGLNEEMNRAQFAKVAALILGLKVDADLRNSSFSDVNLNGSSGWALPYIEAIKKAGITDGVGNGEFNPAGKVSKEQLAAFLIRMLGQDAQAQSVPGAGDGTTSDWARGYVQLALDLGLLGNAPDGTFGGRANASRELLVTGGYESAKILESIQPLEVSGANFAEGNRLELTMTVGIDPSSIDLSKIMVNGVPLDPMLDSYVLSEDRKTIIIKLHEGFKLDTSKTPIIVANGLKTLLGNHVKNGDSNPILVKVTQPPVVPYTPSTPTPVPSPVPDVTLTIDVVNGTITQATTSYPVTGSVTGTAYYSVLTTDAPVPSLDEIKLGVNAAVYGSVQLDGTGANLELSGFTAGTSYVLYAYELANNKTSRVSSVSFQTLIEAQPAPAITFHALGTSRMKGVTSDTIHASVNAEAYDALYYVLVEDIYSDSPSAIQVKSGQDAVGGPALQHGTVDHAVNGFPISISEDLLSNKHYRLYVVGSMGTLDSEIAGFTFYRTDSIIDMFTSLGTPIVNSSSITVSPDYSGSQYQFYYITTDQFTGVNPPSADTVINQGELGTYNSVDGTVSLQGSFSTNTGLYAVIVDYDQTLGDQIRSNVVTYIPIP